MWVVRCGAWQHVEGFPGWLTASCASVCPGHTYFLRSVSIPVPRLTCWMRRWDWRKSHPYNGSNMIHPYQGGRLISSTSMCRCHCAIIVLFIHQTCPSLSVSSAILCLANLSVHRFSFCVHWFAVLLFGSACLSDHLIVRLFGRRPAKCASFRLSTCVRVSLLYLFVSLAGRLSMQTLILPLSFALSCSVYRLSA